MSVRPEDGVDAGVDDALRVLVAAQPCGFAIDLEDIAGDAGRGLHHVDRNTKLIEVLRVHRADGASAKARKERPLGPEVHAVCRRLGVKATDLFRDRGWVELLGGQRVERVQKAARTYGFGSEPRHADPAQREEGVGYAWFWAFLGSLAVIFGVLSWMITRGKLGELD